MCASHSGGNAQASLRLSSLMDPFVDQLAALCRDHVTRNKWVFVPSHGVGRTLGERIALKERTG